MTAELRLLLLSARVSIGAREKDQIRDLLSAGIDWTAFAQLLLNHDVAALCGRNLLELAPDLVPSDIAGAFETLREQFRAKNEALLAELMQILDCLQDHAIKAIPLKGPMLALRAYKDISLRSFRDLDFLIRDEDIEPTISALRDIGYYRQGAFTRTQFALIHRLQGQEIIFQRDRGTCAEPHSRLTPIKMALDIDYPGLWNRARHVEFSGRQVLSLAPLDELLNLAIHGGKELWWNIKWVCDFAAFVESQPDLDWRKAVELAQAQGALRMLLLAVALSRRYLGTKVPNFVETQELGDSAISVLIEHIARNWMAKELSGPPSNKTLSVDRLRLHDGWMRRSRYIARTLVLPAPHHVGLLPLPRAAEFLYVPIKLVHDLIALPIWRIYQSVRSETPR